MANNRLWLVDSETHEAIRLGTGFGDWRFEPTEAAIQKFMEEHDHAGAQGAPTNFVLVDENDPAWVELKIWDGMQYT